MTTKTIYVKNREDLERKKKYIWGIFIEFCGNEFCLKISDVLRNYQQNAKMWPMLTDISLHREFHGSRRSTMEWKTILMSAWMTVEHAMQPDIYKGLEGEVVVLNELKTSQLSKRDFCCFIEYIYYQGSEFGVVWSEKAVTAYDTYKEIYN